MYCIPAWVRCGGMRVCREMVGGWMDGKERGSESKGGEERAEEEESYHWP